MASSHYNGGVMKAPMHQVMVVPGDGIGPEITESTQRVLESSGVRIEWIDSPVSGGVLTEQSLATMRRTGVVLKAPLIAGRCTGGMSVNGRSYPSINNALR